DVYNPDGIRQTNLLRGQLVAEGGDHGLSYRLSLGYLRQSSRLLSEAAPPGYTVPDVTGDGLPEVFAGGVRENLEYTENIVRLAGDIHAHVGGSHRLGAHL